MREQSPIIFFVGPSRSIQGRWCGHKGWDVEKGRTIDDLEGGSWMGQMHCRLHLNCLTQALLWRVIKKWWSYNSWTCRSSFLHQILVPAWWLCDSGGRKESGGLVHCRFTTSRLKFQLSRQEWSHAWGQFVVLLGTKKKRVFSVKEGLAKPKLMWNLCFS